MIDYLKVENANLLTAIDLVCQAAGVRYRVEPHAVIIADAKVPLEEYEHKVFVVEKEALDIMIESTGGGGDGEGGGGDDESGNNSASSGAVKQYFINRGVPFPAGTALRVDEAVSRLVITNTPENLAEISEMLEQLNTEQTTQVMTQVKFVEVALNDLEELGFEYVLSRSTDGKHTIASEQIEFVKEDEDDESGSASFVAEYDGYVYKKKLYNSSSEGGVEIKKPMSGGYTGEMVAAFEKGSTVLIDSEPEEGYAYYKVPTNFTSVFGSSVTFGANSQLVRNAMDDPSAFFATGNANNNDVVINWSHSNKKGYDVSAKMHALDQADSTDILSTPRITTLAGQSAVIKMVTEKYYPDEWDDATLETVSGGDNEEDIPVFQPSIPTFGDAVEEGIVLNVSPQVEDNYVITLPMTPVIQEFVGWTDYSYELPLENDGETRYYPNTLKMPIIEARTVETTIVSFDGETIVLGGVIKDRINIVEDQYPILGDLPLVGRLFQSKGRGSEKVSLLIFMTSRLIKPDGSPIRENQERGIPSFRY